MQINIRSTAVDDCNQEQADQNLPLNQNLVQKTANFHTVGHLVSFSIHALDLHKQSQQNNLTLIAQIKLLWFSIITSRCSVVAKSCSNTPNDC